jgi:hypothetical protein
MFMSSLSCFPPIGCIFHTYFMHISCIFNIFLVCFLAYILHIYYIFYVIFLAYIIHTMCIVHVSCHFQNSNFHEKIQFDLFSPFLMVDVSIAELLGQCQSLTVTVPKC